MSHSIADLQSSRARNVYGGVETRLCGPVSASNWFGFSRLCDASWDQRGRLLLIEFSGANMSMKAVITHAVVEILQQHSGSDAVEVRLLMVHGSGLNIWALEVVVLLEECLFTSISLSSK